MVHTLFYSPRVEMQDFFNHNIFFDEYITGNRFIDICEKKDIAFCKTDNIEEYTDTDQKFFVTHNSDYHIDANRFNLRPKSLKIWYAQNKDFESDLLRGIPIGLENMSLRVNSTSQFGRFSSEPPHGADKAAYISNLAHENKKSDKLVYLNINPNTYPSERIPVLNFFARKNWVTFEAGLDWKDYYKQIASHKFVFSPRGNGTDCHRTWEALYLRTIPIVKKSKAMNEFKNLPILFIDNWDVVTYDFLCEKYEEMSSKLFDLSEMKMSFWDELIQK